MSSADNPCWIKTHFFAAVLSSWLGYLNLWIEGGSRQEKAFFLPNQCIGFLGPPPHVTQRDGTLDRTLQAAPRESHILCMCLNVGQWAGDHYDRRVVADLLMRETMKKAAKANFPHIPQHLSLL